MRKVRYCKMAKNSWWKEAVVYQIYPRSFKDSNGDGIGDLRGIMQKLDYLQELGVSVVWISPIYQSPNKDNGYDISDYQSIMQEFGTMEEFDELLEQAHQRGLKIVLDLVVNHTSDQHPWFRESRKSKENAYRDFYIWKDPVDGHAPTNWGGYFGGSVWQYDEQTKQYYLHQFVPEQPDLNWDNEKVRQAVFDMMKWWCDKGIDGFRMDVISLISKPEQYRDGDVAPGEQYVFCKDFTANGPHVHEYLQEMNREVLSKYDLMTVGETSGVTIEEAKKYAGTDTHELNMIFQFEHVESTEIDNDPLCGKWTIKKMHLPNLKKVLSKWQTELEGSAWNSLFWDNHDQPRIVSRWGNDSLQYREKSAKMLATCLHMMQGTPYVYQGEELGMTNMKFTDISQCDDVEEINAYHEYVTEKHTYSKEEMMDIISRRGRDNARTPMQWDDTKNGGFSEAVPWLQVNPNYVEINAKDQIANPDSVYHFYQKLIQLRKEQQIMIEGHYELLEPDHEQLFIYTRSLDAEKWLVICNFSDQNVTLPQSIQQMIPAHAEQIIANVAEEVKSAISAYGAVVYRIS